MVSLLKRARLAVSAGGEPDWNEIEENAPGRLREGRPVAVIDIGSNSVRLVVYEGLTRSPTAIFNEKVLCGLGRSVATTGRLTDAAVARALASLKRFRALADVMRVDEVHVLATAAARDAANGKTFLAAAAEICRSEPQLLSGKREAELSALGVISGIHEADGLVGDLGGGSLELIEVRGNQLGTGITTPLGGLSLQDASDGSMKKAGKLAQNALKTFDRFAEFEGRNFYAVGGTWRALAGLHMIRKNYPLRVMHGYTIPANEALSLVRSVRRLSESSLAELADVPPGRRPLLAYGALVLDHVLRLAKPKDVVISAMGVREGLLYELLAPETRAQDPLIAAATELGLLRSRSPRQGHELVAWTDRLFESALLEESEDDRRLRHAACHLADIGWRAHPDYRGEQSFNIIANAAFAGVDHPGRTFLALAIYFRHEGLRDVGISPRMRALTSPRLVERARVLGAAMRVAYLMSAAMPGILPRTPLTIDGGRLVQKLPADLGDLAGERLSNRVRQLARLIGKEPVVKIA